MSQFEEIPSPGRGFQGSRVLGIRALAACKTLASKQVSIIDQGGAALSRDDAVRIDWFTRALHSSDHSDRSGRAPRGTLIQHLLL